MARPAGGATRASGTSSSTPDDATMAIVTCYRAHGDPSFPDPVYDPSDGRWHFAISPGSFHCWRRQVRRRVRRSPSGWAAKSATTASNATCPRGGLSGFVVARAAAPSRLPHSTCCRRRSRLRSSSLRRVRLNYSRRNSSLRSPPFGWCASAAKPGRYMTRVGPMLDRGALPTAPIL